MMTAVAIAAAATTDAAPEEIRPTGPRRVRAAAEVSDDEEEHDHDRAGIDEHLRGRDELGRKEQVEDRERGEVPDQRERAVERVREEHDPDSGRKERRHGEYPDDPDEDLHQDSVFQTGSGVS